MHTDGHSSNGHTDGHSGYETRDVALHTLVKWVIGLYIFIGITAAGTIPLYFLLVPKDESRAQRTGQNELRPTIGPLPEPVIQASPIHDMAEFERKQVRTSTSYGRVESEPGKVYIPIEQAMERVLSEGLPSLPRSEGPAAPNGIYTPGDTTAPWPSRTQYLGPLKPSPMSPPLEDTGSSGLPPAEGPGVLQPGVITNGVPPPGGPLTPPAAPGTDMRGVHPGENPAPRPDGPR